MARAKKQEKDRKMGGGAGESSPGYLNQTLQSHPISLPVSCRQPTKVQHCVNDTQGDQLGPL